MSRITQNSLRDIAAIISNHPGGARNAIGLISHLVDAKRFFGHIAGAVGFLIDRSRFTQLKSIGTNSK
ncbi:hypothetical protein AYJ10_18840 [Serratia marcescens]|nr:hypothetical protein AYJ10_18840 [Serratia marcescens]